MALIKKIKDKKVNFEFNKEYIKVVTDKISNNDATFITNSFKEMHPADAADIIEHLGQNDRENLIKLNNFKIDPEVFIELNESIQIEIIKYRMPLELGMKIDPYLVSNHWLFCLYKRLISASSQLMQSLIKSKLAPLLQGRVIEPKMSIDLDQFQELRGQ